MLIVTERFFRVVLLAFFFVGFLDFFGGLFTADWDRMWMGLVKIALGIGKILISVFDYVALAIVNSFVFVFNLAIDTFYGLMNVFLS